MNGAAADDDRSGNHRGAAGRKYLLKAGLAAAILFVVLASVKVRDHLTLPGGVPFAGDHAGWFIHTVQENGDRVLFEEPGTFRFEAFQRNGRIEWARLLNEKDAPLHDFTSTELDKIVLRVGLLSTIKVLHPGLWALALLLYFTAVALTTFRWWLLLRATDLPQSWPRAFRLTFMGFFFNNVVPGQTGGDLVRAYYIARENPKRRTDSVSTVLVDRLLGITALALIAAAVIPTNPDLYGKGAKVIYGFLALLAVSSLVFFSKRMRRLLRLDRLLRKLPFQELFRKVDRSIFLYRYRKATLTVCLVLSFAVHILIISALGVLGRGLEIHQPFPVYLANVPIIFILSSLPLTPAGWGVGELLFVFFFGAAGVLPAKAMALSLIFRVSAAFLSLLGGVFLLLEKDRIRTGDMTLAGVGAEPDERDASKERS